ncbi:sulfatase [Halalkalibaculum sp. DA3122]|uniref:sulfatase family protein n=1 Tax=Halalkalibaculum sp. DA3122 TaxID=3373607 RepID=UPI0037551532
MTRVKMMNSCSQLFWCFSLLAALQMPLVAAADDEQSPRPNIIIFLADDLGYGDLGSYGHPVIQTPHLDRFAKQGVRMLDMHSAGTVCSPSRASLLTGRNAYRSGYYNIAGFWGTTLQKEEITIGHLLQEAGYETAYFGKWHLSKLENDDEVGINEMGFDYSFATSVNAFEGPENPQKFIRNGTAVGEVQGWYVDVIVEEASNWITNKKEDDDPFFAIIATHEPHTPISPPKKFSQLYQDQEIQKLSRHIEYGGVPRPLRDISKNKKEYYGTVTQVDHAFGDLMQFVDDERLAENTLVVFTSDNGPEYPVSLEESYGEWEDPIRDKSFGTPGKLRGMKRYPYEGGHRVPGLARWPGHIPAGIVSDKLFNGTDFLPTIANLTGASIPNDRPIDGTDAFNAFLDKEYDREVSPMWFFPVNYSHMPGMAHMAMRKDNHVLVGHLSPNPENVAGDKKIDWIKTAFPVDFELYNIENDVTQTINLAETKHELMKDLIPMMQRRWINIRDEGPWWNRAD